MVDCAGKWQRVHVPVDARLARIRRIAVLTGLLEISVWGIVDCTLVVTDLTESFASSSICIATWRQRALASPSLQPSHPLRF